MSHYMKFHTRSFISPSTNYLKIINNSGYFSQMYVHTYFQFAIPFYRPQRSWSKVMFSHVSVILFTGVGCPPQCMLGYTPWEQTPLPQEQTPPWEQIPQHALRQTTPPRTDPPGSSVYWEIRATNGRYASYWNAYLLI